MWRRDAAGVWSLHPTVSFLKLRRMHHGLSDHMSLGTAVNPCYPLRPSKSVSYKVIKGRLCLIHFRKRLLIIFVEMLEVSGVQAAVRSAMHW